MIRDPVHGLVSFVGPIEEIVPRLLDCQEVQRLRRIRVLGLVSLVFPGAEHSRFAHALGSAYVMKRYLERVRSLGSDLPAHDRVDGEMAMVALAAALLHDLGHGPYSHTFEGVMEHLPRHETWTSQIILDPATEVHRVLADVDPTMPAQVERLIHGHSPIPHLARAVSGTFDVDRCDYLLRDSYMTGVRYGLLDLDWLFASLRLYLPPKERFVRLAIDGDKGLTAVEGFFLARLYMYRQVYFHKAVRAAEAVMTALFRRLSELGPQPGTPPALEALLRKQTISVATYGQLDDISLEQALNAYTQSKDQILAELAQRLRRRRLFKTLALHPQSSSEAAQRRLSEVLQKLAITPAYVGMIDRVEIKAYSEDQALGVLGRDGEIHDLLAASPLLRGVSHETFIHHRAIFPPEAELQVRKAMAEFI